MSHIGYICKRLLDMDYKAMFQKIDGMHKKTGRSRLWLLWDMRRCAVKYGAGYMNYELYEMYDMTPQQRDTYLTRGRVNAIIKQYNDLSYSHCFDNKDEFYTLFDAFIRRSWIRLSAPREQVLDFIRSREMLMAKPVEGSCGIGVEKIRIAEYGSPEAVYDHLIGLGTPMLLEDVITQHPAVDAIYPGSINTVRTLSLHKDGVSHIIATSVRIGANGNHVDNFESGGMVAPVDEQTGIIKYKAVSKSKIKFESHPQTGTRIEGFQFPDWDKAMDMVKEAAKVVPQMGYIGWDVAFTPDGPCLVEGNNFPGTDLHQMPEHTPDKTGIMPRFNV